MKRLVSQKIRLIASLRGGGSRRRPRVRISRASFRNLASATADRFPIAALLPLQTIADTSPAGPDTFLAGPRIQGPLWSLPARDDRDRLCETSGGALRTSRTTCGNGRDWERGWPRNAARYGHKRRGGVPLLCPLVWPARVFLRSKNPRRRGARDGAERRRSRPHPRL